MDYGRGFSAKEVHFPQLSLFTVWTRRCSMAERPSHLTLPSTLDTEESNRGPPLLQSDQALIVMEKMVLKGSADV